MRHSLIYNYLREPGVSMSQNADKHPCSKHLTTVDKGTIFYWNCHKKTNKKFGKVPIFNRKLVWFGNNSYLCIARTRQASPRCSNVRVVLYFVGLTDEILLICHYPILSGHLIRHLSVHLIRHLSVHLLSKLFRSLFRNLFRNGFRGHGGG